MLTWNDYVSKQLTGTGNVSQGAIAGLDGSIWAISEGWGVTEQECKAIATGFTNPSGFHQSGVTCAGERYIFLSGNESVLRARKGSQGIHVAKTNTAIIIAKYDEPIQPGQCAATVEALADYLKSVNY
ncbi:profilin-like [Palaemon carinicauda]|uniref:profilin-like n=1 Tax=Palaemon carinicauda TaxID=392227 RepID=UPI0035B609A0